MKLDNAQHSVQIKTAINKHKPSVFTALLKPLSLSMLAITSGLFLFDRSALADIVANSSAPVQQQPLVTNSANGTPQVNIQAPNANGLSHNRYQQFDVDSRGAILNNSRNNVSTQLGGFVVGNPNLIGGEARVILNEVNSSDPSQLRGFVEVAGQRADVIVANPSGITCNGCGFINSAGNTLTTGTPIINGGALTGFDVRQGTVRIEGAGLNSENTDYTSIIARATEINANLHANEIRVVTGANQVSADGLTATAQASSGTSPAVAIDVSNLGGMYAGKIHLIATESGVGVNNAGTLASSAGALTLNANGTLSNGGQLSATTDIAITQAGRIDNNGRIRADRNLQVTGQSLNNTATITAQNNTQINTTSDISQTTSGLIAAGVDRNLVLRGTGNLNLSSGADIQNAGQINAAQEARIAATAELRNSNTIDAKTTFITANALSNQPTGRIFGDDIAIGTTTLSNVGNSSSAPTIAARRLLNIGTSNLTNRQQGLIFSAGDLAIGGELNPQRQAINSATTVQNNSATLEAQGALNLSAQNIFNTNEQISVTQVTLPVENITEFMLNTGDVREHRGRDIINRHSPSAITLFGCETRCIRINATGDSSDAFTQFTFTRTTTEERLQTSQPGQIIAGGNLNLNFTQANNQQSRIIAGGNLNLQGGTLNNINRNGQRVITDQGTATSFRRRRRSGSDGTTITTTNYAPAPVVEVLELVSAETMSNTASSTGNGDSVPNSVTLNTSSVSLPTGSLFQIFPASNSQFLVETNPQFTNSRNFISSDFFLNQVQTQPGVAQKRLGDGFFEQRIVQEQITQLTGQRYLAGYNSNELQYRDLLQAGVDYAQSFNLRPGVELSAAEINNLTQDIVWLVEQQVTLADGSTQAVLAPQLYLANSRNPQQQSIATISAGGNTNLNLSNNLNSNGLIQAQNNLDVRAENINAEGGALRSNNVSLDSRNDTQLRGIQVVAQEQVSITAGRDITVAAVVDENSNEQGRRQFIRQQAGISATGANAEISLDAGRDITLQAAQLNSQGNANLTAGNDLALTTVKTQQSDNLVWSNKHYSKQSAEQEVGASLRTQGDLTLNAQNTIQARGGRLRAENGDLSLQADNITLEAAENIQTLNARATLTSKGFASKRTLTTIDNLNYSEAQGSELSGRRVQLLSSNNIQLTGAQLVADNDLSLNAGQHISINAAQNRRDDHRIYDEKKSGVFSGGSFGVSVGSQRRSESNDSQQGYLTSSTLGSLNGDVSINAGGDATLTATDLLSQQGNISIEGDNVTLDSGNETLQREQVIKLKQSGITLALSGGVVDTVNTIQNSVERINNTDNSKLQALHAWRAGRSAEQLEQGINNLGNIGNDFADPLSANDGEGAQSSGVNLSISLGSSKSEQINRINNSEALGSSVIAQGDVNITARGDDANPENGNLLSRGTLIEGENVNLTAANDITLTSAENVRTDDTQSKSSSSGIGLSIGSDGLQVFAEASKSRGEINKSSDQYLETQINASNTAALTSAQDTQLEGAQVNANRIIANVGGDLTITSQQDEERYRNRQESIGGRIGVGIGASSPINLSINASELKADSHYIAVQEQSGLFAGEGGFDVNVGQNTNLQGGAIVSEANPDSNRLNTETLSASNLENNAKYNVESKTISFSTSGVGSATQGFGGGFSEDEGEASNTTFSAISEGAVEVRANPNQSLDNIKRSKEQAHQVLARIFNEDKVADIEEKAEVQQILSQEVPQAIGDYAQARLAQADVLLAQANNTTDPKERNALLDRAQKLTEDWGEGGRYRVALHTFSGALSGDLAGALGAYATAKTVSDIADALNDVGLDKPSSEALLLLASASIGGLANGEVGALNTLGQSANNYLKHNEIESLASELKGCADRQCQLNVAKKYERISEQNNQALAAACSEGKGSNACGRLTAEVADAGQTYQRVIAEGEGFTRNILGTFALAQTFEVTEISHSALVGRALKDQGFSEEQVATVTTVISAALGGRRGSGVGSKKEKVEGSGPEGNVSS